MTEFQKKRLQFLIKAANKQEWIQLNQGDAELLDGETQYEKGFDDGVQYFDEDIEPVKHTEESMDNLRKKLINEEI